MIPYWLNDEIGLDRLHLGSYRLVLLALYLWVVRVEWDMGLLSGHGWTWKGCHQQFELTPVYPNPTWWYLCSEFLALRTDLPWTRRYPSVVHCAVHYRFALLDIFEEPSLFLFQRSKNSYPL